MSLFMLIPAELVLIRADNVEVLAVAVLLLMLMLLMLVFISPVMFETFKLLI